jgi:acetyl esterase/lipase
MKQALAALIAAFALLEPAFPAPTEPSAIPVWPGIAPGSETWTQKEVEYLNPEGERMVRNVVHPTLSLFLPNASTATRTAVIVCPGGAFRFLSWQTEGTEVAQWLSARGVAAFVLRYRLVDTGVTELDLQRHMDALFSTLLPREGPRGVAATGGIGALAIEDGRQALRLVRREAARFGIACDRIGILGFSAGAIVAAAVGVSLESESRPDFVAPIYGLRIDDAAVPATAPPLFTLAADDDPLVPVSESLRLFSDWKAAGRPAELHVYAKGGHGFGMKKQGLPIDGWIERFAEWLSAQGDGNSPSADGRRAR